MIAIKKNLQIPKKINFGCNQLNLSLVFMEKKDHSIDVIWQYSVSSQTKPKQRTIF